MDDGEAPLRVAGQMRADHAHVRREPRAGGDEDDVRLLRHADAGILDRDRHVPEPRTGRHPDRPDDDMTLLRELQRVADEVDEHLDHPVVVDVEQAWLMIMPGIFHSILLKN